MDCSYKLWLRMMAAFLIGLWLLPVTADELIRDDLTCDQPSTAQVAPNQVGHPTFMSPHTAPITFSDGFVFVANTPADTVDVIDAKTRKIKQRLSVGIDPVSLTFRPDHKELWVSNHVSDSVSVIDTDSKSKTYLQIVDTIQEFDQKTKSTRFDEPVGIAFANNEKAYVALSSENQIAVIDVITRKITKRLTINAQDPRAIVVRNGRLFVIPFESNNKTQLSGGTGRLDGDLYTFNAWEHSVANNNVLSIGAVLDIVKNPKVPDRDLYVFDTETDKLVETVSTLGTLLYGLAVDSKGNAFVAQTDARNDANGRAGTQAHGLAELENRAFMNRITRVSFAADKESKNPKSEKRFFDLEPLPPHHPKPGEALATPFAIQISPDDSTLFATAAGSDIFFTVDASTGLVLGRTRVGAVPRGIALETDGKSTPYAWVLNAVDNTVSVVDISNAAQPKEVDSVELEDPTHPAVKRGRIAFNTARASTTETFACASCHPDGHTDQLLWVLKTPVVSGGKQIMPRSTMPIRGLRDTAPYHWDGIPGDPYGGNNSANIWGSDAPNSSKEIPTSTTRHLIDGGLASTMAKVGDDTKNNEGKAGKLTSQERDDMAIFLFSVPYPPAQKRAYTNVVSKRARQGFKLFHIDGDHDEKPTPNVCGNCHRMPFLVSTNTPGTGMDAPTWRGAYDRFLILPQGRLNIIDFDFYRAIAERGIPERNMWQFSWGGRRRFDPVWDMVLEGSTGYAGAFGRQITLNQRTAQQATSSELLDALELAASEQAVVLEANGVAFDSKGSDKREVAYQFDGATDQYISTKDTERLSRADLIELAAQGQFVGTFSARHGKRDSVDTPQPAIWTLGPLEQQSGRQEFPMLYPGNQAMTLSGRYVSHQAQIFVNGRRVNGEVFVEPSDELIRIKLNQLPETGMHLLQLQNPQGLFSNDFIFHVTESENAAKQLKEKTDRQHTDVRGAFVSAAGRGDLDAIKELLRGGARINARQPSGGSTALSNASLHGQLDVVKFLLSKGARVNATNEDGNTALLVAAFVCNEEIVKLLLENGADPKKKNDRGESAIDSLSQEWSDDLAKFYTSIGQLVRIEFDLDRLEAERPQILAILRSATD